MERRTDTDNRLSGMGPNSPMPGGCAGCPFRQTIESLTKRVEQLEEERRLRMQYYAQLTQGYAAPMATAATPLATPVADEPLIAELPAMFIYPLHKDVRRANSLVRLLRGELLQRVKDRRHGTMKWYHVYKTLFDCQLILENTKPATFGRDIKKIVAGLPSEDTLRREASKDDVSHGGSNFHSWPDNNTDKNLCLEVEDLLVKAGVL